MTGSQGRYPHPVRGGVCGCLPALAHLGQESRTGGIVLVKPFIAVRTVVADRRTIEEDPAARRGC